MNIYNPNNSNEQSTNKDNDTNDEFSAFLFKLLDKNPIKVSMFFEFFDIQNNRLKDLVKLHDCYSDVFDPRFFNPSLFGTTVELIKEVAKLKEDTSEKLAEIERILNDQKNELATVKTENQLMSSSIKENVKYCIDPSNKTYMKPNTDYVLPLDA